MTPASVATPTITDYRTYLQLELHLKPNSVKRSLMSLKRYFAWLVSSGKITSNPAKVVKLVGEEVSAPRQLDDQEEQALVAAVTERGNCVIARSLSSCCIPDCERENAVR